MNVRGVGAPAPASWSSPAVHFSSESYIFFAVLAYLSFSHCVLLAMRTIIEGSWRMHVHILLECIAVYYINI